MVDPAPEIIPSDMPDLWDMVLLPRCQGPPLRFRGRRIAHRSHRLTGDTLIFVDVWIRKKGDYAVAYSNFEDGIIKPDAHVVKAIDDVSGYLQNRCNRPSKPPLVPDIASVLSGLMRDMALQQQFAILVGDFLETFEVFHNQQNGVQTQQNEV